MKSAFSDILCIFPDAIRLHIENALKNYPDAMELRLIAEESVFLYTPTGIKFVCKNKCFI